MEYYDYQNEYPENECRYCGEPCEKTYCDKQCERADEDQVLNMLVNQVVRNGYLFYYMLLHIKMQYKA